MALGPTQYPGDESTLYGIQPRPADRNAYKVRITSSEDQFMTANDTSARDGNAICLWSKYIHVFS